MIDFKKYITGKNIAIVSTIILLVGVIYQREQVKVDKLRAENEKKQHILTAYEKLINTLEKQNGLYDEARELDQLTERHHEPHTNKISLPSDNLSKIHEKYRQVNQLDQAIDNIRETIAELKGVPKDDIIGAQVPNPPIITDFTITIREEDNN